MSVNEQLFGWQQFVTFLLPKLDFGANERCARAQLCDAQVHGVSACVQLIQTALRKHPVLCGAFQMLLTARAIERGALQVLEDHRLCFLLGFESLLQLTRLQAHGVPL